jgi:hypothetical protein
VLLLAASAAMAQEEGGASGADAGSTGDPAAAEAGTTEQGGVTNISTDEAQPYFLRASQGLAHDDNIYRVPDRLGPKSDWISSTALIAGFTQPFGRQRGYGNATLRGNSYRDQSQLNNLGYDLGLGLDWATVERISGNVSMQASQGLASFADYGSANAEAIGKNQELSQRYAARAQYGITAAWALTALLEYERIDYTADEFANRERNGTTFGGGVRYRPSGIWAFGLGARRIDGSYPQSTVRNGVVIADDYTSDNIDLTATLIATGLSTFSARLTFTDEEHELDSSRDYSGLTGSIEWDYQITGKVGLGLSLSRETGTSSNSTTITGVNTFLTDSNLTNRVGLRATWDATGKIRVTAAAAYWRDNFDDQFTEIIDGGAVIRVSDESASSYSLDLRVRYQPTRTVTLECGARYNDRGSTGRTINLDDGFTSTTGFCNAILALRG